MSSPFLKLNGLILREVRYKEADRILTVLTAERGKLTVKARGALRKSSKIGAATQQLTFSELTLFENGGKLTVNEAVIKEPFEGLRKKFSAFALGCYFAEVTEALAREEIPEPTVLQLILNCLYALSCGLYPEALIKATFELRLASVLGYTPNLTACAVCGDTDPVHPTIGLASGRLCCRECRNAAIGITDYLTPAALETMRRILSAPPKRILFHSSDTVAESEPFLFRACEDFLLEQCSRSFPTLEYYKSYKL